MTEPAHIPVFCISLARAKERRATMRRRLDALGMPYEFVGGVDGEKLDFSHYKNRLRPDAFRRIRGREMSPGEVGCFLSHHNLWRRIIAEQTECALVLEDDAQWDGDLPDVVADVAACEWQWDVVMLSAPNRIAAERTVCGVGKNGRNLVRYKWRATNTAGYLIRLSGAAKLFGHCWEIRAPIDWLMPEWWLNGAKVYGVRPPPVFADGAASLITHRGRIAAPFSGRVAASLARKCDRMHCRFCRWTKPPQKKNGAEIAEWKKQWKL